MDLARFSQIINGMNFKRGVESATSRSARSFDKIYSTYIDGRIIINCTTNKNINS